MASNFFPMLSSSPPPIDDNDCIDEEDEFHTYTSACFDDSFDSPVSSLNFKPINVDCEKKSNDVKISGLNRESDSFPDGFTQSSYCTQVKSVKDEHGNVHSYEIKPNIKQDLNGIETDSPCLNSEHVETGQCNFEHSKGLHQVSDESLNHRHINECDLVPTSVNTCAFPDGDDASSIAKRNSNIIKNLDAEHCSEIISNASEGVFDDDEACTSSKEFIHLEDTRPRRVESKSDLENNTISNSISIVSNNCESSLLKETNSLTDANLDEFGEFQADFYCDRKLVLENESMHLGSTCDLERDIKNSLLRTHLLEKDTGSSVDSLNVEIDNNEILDKDFDDFQNCEPLNLTSETDDFQTSESFNLKKFKNPQNLDDVHSDDETDQYCDFQNFENVAPIAEKDDFHEFEKSEAANLASDDDDDFADFKNCDNPISKDVSFDEFKFCEKIDTTSKDDFAEFTNSGNSDFVQEPGDFDDFQTCEISSQPHNDFADFKGASFSVESEKCSKSSNDGEEFADFEAASFKVSSNVPFTADHSHSSTSQEQGKGSDKLSTVMRTIFPLSETEIQEAEHDMSFTEILNQSSKSQRLWEKLHEVEQTPGLRFQWPISHTFQRLLRSVNVDYHSILRTSSVPIFASGLSILEPVKGPTNPTASQDFEDGSLSIRDPIPPVEFDWNGSGLINPLDAVQISSALMDLSFLSSASAATQSSTSNDHSFENELLNSNSSLDCKKATGKTLILEQLLSNTVSSLPCSSKAHRPPNISQEASHVLDQLPDINFMQAKVLMFPISSKT